MKRLLILLCCVVAVLLSSCAPEVDGRGVVRSTEYQNDGSCIFGIMLLRGSIDVRECSLYGSADDYNVGDTLYLK